MMIPLCKPMPSPVHLPREKRFHRGDPTLSTADGVGSKSKMIVSGGETDLSLTATDFELGAWLWTVGVFAWTVKAEGFQDMHLHSRHFQMLAICHHLDMGISLGNQLTLKPAPFLVLVVDVDVDGHLTTTIRDPDLVPHQHLLPHLRLRPLLQRAQRPSARSPITTTLRTNNCPFISPASNYGPTIPMRCAAGAM